MKKKIAMIALIMLSLFSLIFITSSSEEVYACEAPLPHADLPNPCNS